MANRRARCFNTLTINGNQRPIKFKRIKKDMSAFQPIISESRKISNEWCETKLENLYLTDQQKEELAMKTGLAVEQVKRWMGNKRSRANNIKKQIPNYFIQKHLEYSQHVQMVSVRRHFLRKLKRTG
jgi:hypothetical protein